MAWSTWANVDPDLCCHISSLGLNVLMQNRCNSIAKEWGYISFPLSLQFYFSRKYIWNCCLQIVYHFVPTSLCEFSLIRCRLFHCPHLIAVSVVWDTGVGWGCTQLLCDANCSLYTEYVQYLTQEIFVLYCYSQNLYFTGAQNLYFAGFKCIQFQIYISFILKKSSLALNSLF